MKYEAERNVRTRSAGNRLWSDTSLYQAVIDAE